MPHQESFSGLAPTRRLARGLPALLCFAALLLTACEDEPTESPEAPVGELIGPAGGSVLSTDGNVFLYFPPGAVTEEVYISITPVTEYPEPERVVGGTVYEVAPVDLTLAGPVELTITLESDSIPAEVIVSEVRLHTLVDEAWQRVVGSTVGSSEGWYSQGQIDHLGVFGIAEFAETEGLDGYVSPNHRTLVVGETATVTARIFNYRVGSLPANSAEWEIGTTGVARLAHEAGDSCRIEALSPGETMVAALIDGEFVDTVTVRVVEPGDVQPGMVRWRHRLSSYPTSPGPSGSVALDGPGRIYLVDFGLGFLFAFDPRGIEIYNVPSCGSALSPSVTADGTAYTTCNRSTQRHGSDGSILWSVPFGTLDGGVAVDVDRSAAVLYATLDDSIYDDLNDVSVLISKISTDGSEQWDTLVALRGQLYQKTAPAIDADGNIYFAWLESVAESLYWAERRSPDGMLRWRMPIPDWIDSQSPALAHDQIIFTTVSGIVAFDTAGTAAWDWDLGPSGVSSPVIDADGNIYVQTDEGLHSFTPTGTLRWASAEVAYTNHFFTGAPSLLQDGSLLVACDVAFSVDEICSVRVSDGALLWRSTAELEYPGPATVGSDGMIFVVSDRNELVALWGPSPPLAAGWPTEGGGMGRLRRQLYP